MKKEYICNIESQKDIKYAQDTLYVISGKWRMQIMVALFNGHHRYREIAKSIPGITFRMLSRELKEMELNKLVSRSVCEDAPKDVEYAPTDYCQTLYPLIEDMISWAKRHREVIR